MLASASTQKNSAASRARRKRFSGEVWRRRNHPHPKFACALQLYASAPIAVSRERSPPLSGNGTVDAGPRLD
jgi:hypothetical protein